MIRALLVPGLFALATWAGLGVLLDALTRSQGATLPQEVLLARLSVLGRESLPALLGPIVLLALAGLFSRATGRSWSMRQALVAGLRMGLAVFGVAPLLWGGMAVWAGEQGQDPWEGLPGITPPYLEDFLARHPGLTATTFGGTRRLLLHAGGGRTVYVDGDDLAGANVRFDPCPPELPAAAALGGIPPYPAARCVTVLGMRRGPVERGIFVFETPPGEERERIRGHFESWAGSIGAQFEFPGGPNLYQFRARKGDAQWDLQMFVRRSSPTMLYVPRGGRTVPWPETEPAAAR